MTPQRVWKVAEATNATGEKVRVLVQLHVCEKGRNNFKRQNIVYPANAKYRIERGIVEVIVDDDGNPHKEATSLFHPLNKLTYRVGEEVVSNGWEKDTTIVSAAGIHCFLSKEVADDYMRHIKGYGPIRLYHDNGVLAEENYYIHSKRNGPSQSWTSDGKLQTSAFFINDRKEGPFVRYSFNGLPLERCFYENGEIDGLYEKWHWNGSIHCRQIFKNGKAIGTSEFYFLNGNIRVRCFFEDGICKIIHYYDNDGSVKKEMHTNLSKFDFDLP